MSFGFFHGFAPIKQPATCGPLITEAAGITDDNLFTVLCSHNHLSFLSYSLTSWKNLSGKSCVIHGLAQKCSLVPKCHILLSHSNSLFIMMELHLHLRFTSGWISVGSVPSPLDDPHSEATQPRGDPDLQVLNSGVQSITLGRRPQFFPETSTNPTR